MHEPSLHSRTQSTLRRTYSTLISAGRGRTRLQQLIDWVGGAAFEGVICLDECHKGEPQGPAGWEPGLRQGQRLRKGAAGVLLGPRRATAPAPRPPYSHLLPARRLLSAAKNFVPGKEKQSTKVSQCVLDLQRQLPRARFVYCSATGVSGAGVCRKWGWGGGGLPAGAHTSSLLDPCTLLAC